MGARGNLVSLEAVAGLVGDFNAAAASSGERVSDGIFFLA